jgi:hypothetical protein
MYHTPAAQHHRRWGQLAKMYLLYDEDEVALRKKIQPLTLTSVIPNKQKPPYTCSSDFSSEEKREQWF